MSKEITQHCIFSKNNYLKPTGFLSIEMKRDLIFRQRTMRQIIKNNIFIDSRYFCNFTFRTKKRNKDF